MHLKSNNNCHIFGNSQFVIRINISLSNQNQKNMKSILLKQLFLILLVTGFSVLNAQESKPVKISKAVYFDISKPLRDITPIQPGLRERTWKNKQVPNKFGIENDLKNMVPLPGKDHVLQDNLRGTTEGGTVGQNFAGIGNLSGVAPPDTDGDVGPNHYFQMVNMAFAIWDKEGTLLYGPADNITLWDNFPGPWASTNDGDPVVLYDEMADRWIATQFSLPNYPSGPFYELVAVSQTGDPTGAWNRYAFEFDAMPDYPKFGVWTDGYYMTTHKFNPSFIGAGITILDRDAMIAGEVDAEMIEFHVGSGFYGVLAADFDGETLPPAGSPNYLLDVVSNSLRMWEVSIDWEIPDNSSLNGLGLLPTQPFSTNGISIAQPGTSNKLDDLSGMTMYRLQYRNFEDYEVLLTNHTVNGGNGKAGVRWYELRKYDSDWEIYQQGTFAPDDGDNRWMGSIAMNGNGDIGLGYSVSGATTYPSIRFVGQTAGAPLGLGVFDIDETSILEGSKSQTGVSRWGDYACMSIDPSDDETFWFTTEYSNGGWNWKTQIASFGFVQVPIVDFSADDLLIPVGETINFYDETSGIPEEWKWIFEGGEPATSSDENPEGILFATEGIFNVQLIAINDLGSDTLIKEAYITTSSTILPEVDFVADKSSICVGDTIWFTDFTQYKPNQWQWNFNPNSVTFVYGTSETSQNPVIVIDEAGLFDVSLTAWNLNGSSVLEKPELIKAGGYLPYFKETFEDGTYYANNWAVENPDSDVTWKLYEVGGTVPGIMAAGIDFSNYFAIGQRDRLISPAFNLEGLGSAALGFQHAYAQRMPEGADSLIVLVSPDCGENWTRIFADAEDGSGNFATHELVDDFWPETNEDWCITGWGASCINLDLSAWAGQANVKVAFESYSFYGNPLMIDNVTISQYLGVDESNTNEKEIKVYPNPTNGQFTIMLPDNYSYTEVMLINQLGQTVFKRSTDGISNIIEVKMGSSLQKGMYFLKVKNNDEEIVTKVLIN